MGKVMSWKDAFKLSVTFSVSLVSVAALFYGIMNASLNGIENNLSEIRNDVHSLRENVHALDIRLARLEERIPPIDWRQAASVTLD